MTASLVSVIIPCYNQGHFLAEAIESVLGQTYPHVEVIVVNDGSTDETPEVAGRFEGRIRYIEQDNAGLAGARNRGILESRGEFLLFLDSDDTIDRGLVEALVHTVTGSDVRTLACSGYRVSDTFGRTIADFPIGDLPGDFFHSVLACEFFLPVHAFLVPREMLARVGIFDGALRSCEDRDFWLRMGLAGAKLQATKGPQVTYRRHQSNMTLNRRAMWRTSARVHEMNAARHGNCRECRRALRKGLRTLRTNYLQLAFWDEFRQARRTKGLMGSTGWLVSRFLREPSVIPAFVLRPVHRLAWHFRPDLRPQF